MKNIESKYCKAEGCGKSFHPYKTTDKYCSFACTTKATQAKNSKKTETKKIAETKVKVAGKRIKTSSKALKDLAIYRPIRDEYLRMHTTCEVRECDRPSNHIHHMAGRVGYFDAEARMAGTMLLWDTRYFMACCEVCHPHKIHHESNDGWARKEGYILTPKPR